MNKNISKTEKGLLLIPIGGCSTIGMNLYAYVWNDQWILVDMGMGFDNALGRELLVPSPDLLVRNKSKIKALFITHSHEDHIGAIPYLWPRIECPIYGRSFAIEMVRDKLSQFEMASNVPLIKASTKSAIVIGDFKVEFIPVAHSTPESSALAITTPDGTVIHTGDWRLDDDPVLGTKTDEEKLRSYSTNSKDGVLALVCDSTNVFRDEMFGSEREVRSTIIKLVQDNPKNRVLITCFASNLARLETCYMAAKESGRQMAIAGRSLKRIERIARVSGYLSNIPAFLDDKKASSLDPSKVLLVCTGSQGERSSALNQMANDTHNAIKLNDEDIIIFSSRVIPGNEKAVVNMQNLLIGKGIKVISDGEDNIHASGHPSKAELHHLYSITNPNLLIPIHGETMQLCRHAEIAKAYGIPNVLVPRDGSVLKLTRNDPKIIETLEMETLAVDGHKLIPLDGQVYKQRQSLSSCGAVSVCISQGKGVIKLLDFVCYGLFENSEYNEEEDIRKDIASEIKLSLGNIAHKKLSPKDVKMPVEKIIRNILMDSIGKRPVIFVHLVQG
ncbi:MAG: ribonuclease J [Holosporaceae bacterium]|jgi:ribonuclease J|nr:ribonuclease J [Holosporaceae bacterium]